jgi:hypothetical protein
VGNIARRGEIILHENYTGKPEGKSPLLGTELYRRVTLKRILNKFCIGF